MCRKRIFINYILLTFIIAMNALGADWSQWRGNDRNDITSEMSGFPEKWAPKRIWDKNVGKGCTSPIMVDGKIYVMGWQGEGDLNRNPMGTDTLYCLDAQTGKELWKQTYPCRYQSRIRIGDESQYGGPSSTPAFDLKTKYLYTLSIDGDLRCWDTAKNGQLVWSINLYDKYSIPQRPDVGRGKRDYGFTSSPLIQDDLIIIEVGSDEGTVMAFDKKTGQRRWASECKEPAGHTSGPVIITIDGVKCLATLTLKKLAVMRIDKGNEGKTVAEYHWQSDYANNIPTPAVIDNKILLTSGWNAKKTAFVEVSLNGNVVEIWRAKDFSQICSPIIYNGNIYMVDEQLKCLDITNGQTKWKGGNFGYGSCLITKDNKIIAFGNGQLVLAETNPSDNKYNELSIVKDIVPDICYPHVTFSNGIICCKDKSGNMVCFSVK